MKKKVNTTSGALRAAKKYLWRGNGSWNGFLHSPDKQVYICDALGRAYFAGHITQKAKTAATKLIMTRLGQYVSVGSWLEGNVGYRVKFGTGHSIYYKHVQAYRHRWVDALIQEFEAKGD